jgi:hypothetical protein
MTLTKQLWYEAAARMCKNEQQLMFIAYIDWMKANS